LYERYLTPLTGRASRRTTSARPPSSQVDRHYTDRSAAPAPKAVLPGQRPRTPRRPLRRTTCVEIRAKWPRARARDPAHLGTGARRGTATTNSPHARTANAVPGGRPCPRRTAHSRPPLPVPTLPPAGPPRRNHPDTMTDPVLPHSATGHLLQIMGSGPRPAFPGFTTRRLRIRRARSASAIRRSGTARRYSPPPTPVPPRHRDATTGVTSRDNHELMIFRSCRWSGGPRSGVG
jgi:hypothetical protein